ncbi:hypothetical protein [Kitasatospora sp. McL0602]|uniref:hypothetical protein n=1 Tax=Kitasatospora sp. McL0602 TaxID=3439530 RepID=UPI003F896A24
MRDSGQWDTKGTAMDEDESLRRYGLRPTGTSLGEVRELLTAQTRLERRAQGDGDTALMKLCCVQLFHAGGLDDVLLVWSAKTASFDSDCSIDIQLLCGAGLPETKAWLAARSTPEAGEALRRLLDCEAADDFEGFSVGTRSAWYAEYYTS